MAAAQPRPSAFFIEHFSSWLDVLRPEAKVA
jgi:hypothetical protein